MRGSARAPERRSSWPVPSLEKGNIRGVPAESVILVTGCSCGIGRATVLEAAAQGPPCLRDRPQPRRPRRSRAPRASRVLRLDVTEPDSIREAMEAALSRAGRLDALVNNAGYGQYGAVEEVTPDEWRAQFEVNFFGAIAVTQAAVPAMRRERRGTIVNVSSVAGRVPIPFAAPYCASKHALEAVSDALRVDSRRSGSASCSSNRARSRPGSASTPGRSSRLSLAARTVPRDLRARRESDGGGVPEGQAAARGRRPRRRECNRISPPAVPLPGRDHGESAHSRLTVRFPTAGSTR